MKRVRRLLSSSSTAVPPPVEPPVARGVLPGIAASPWRGMVEAVAQAAAVGMQAGHGATVAPVRVRGLREPWHS